jgi:gliding motility-associated-like protein
MKNSLLILFLLIARNYFSQGCNADVSVCSQGQAGPFIFDQNTAGPPVDYEPDFGCETGSSGNDNGFGFILLQITQSGPLNLLIDGNNNDGFVDVIVYNIPNGIAPCQAVLNSNNEIGCNFAPEAVGCTQFGDDFPCNSSVTAPNVVAGQTIMIIAHDWSTENTSFTLQLGATGAQSGPPNGTITAVAADICNNATPFQLQVSDLGGTWSGSGVSSSGLFNPSNATIGQNIINYEIGVAPCNSSGTTTINVVDCTIPTCTVTATNSGPVCTGESFNLNASVVPDAISYTWSGNGLSSTDQNPTNLIAPALTGNYDYTVTVQIDGNTCSSTTSLIVNEFADATITPIIGAICLDTVAFQLASSNPGGTWSGTGITNTGLFDAAIAGIGSHQITYAIGGACGDNQSILLDVIDCSIPFCTVTASSTNQICIGQTFDLLATVVPNALNYTWSGNGFQSNSQNNSAINLPLPPGIYTFDVVVNTLDATCNSTTTLTVNPLPQIFAGNDTIICDGESITLNPSGGNIYQWDSGIQSGTSFSPSISNTYSVIGTDANNCTSSDAITVTVISPIIPTFTQDTLSGCSPLRVNFTNTTPNANNSSWLFNGSSILYGETISKTFNGSSECFDVTLICDINSCENNYTAHDLICVNSRPSANFSYIANETSDTEASLLFENASTDAISYLWDFGDSSITSTEENPAHQYIKTNINEFIITLVARSELGCSDTTYQTYRFKDKLIYYVANTFTPNGDELNQSFKPYFTSGFEIFSYKLQIYNRWGQLIFESYDSNIGWDGTYDNRLVSQGIYTWKIEFISLVDLKTHEIHGTVGVLK